MPPGGGSLQCWCPAASAIPGPCYTFRAPDPVPLTAQAVRRVQSTRWCTYLATSVPSSTPDCPCLLRSCSHLPTQHPSSTQLPPGAPALHPPSAQASIALPPPVIQQLTVLQGLLHPYPTALLCQAGGDRGSCHEWTGSLVRHPDRISCCRSLYPKGDVALLATLVARWLPRPSLLLPCLLAGSVYDCSPSSALNSCAVCTACAASACLQLRPGARAWLSQVRPATAAGPSPGCQPATAAHKASAGGGVELRRRNQTCMMCTSPCSCAEHRPTTAFLNYPWSSGSAAGQTRVPPGTRTGCSHSLTAGHASPDHQ